MSAYVIEDIKVGDLHYELDTNKKTAKVIKNDEYVELTSAYIPSYVSYGGQQYRVTAIGEYAFFASEKIKSITIPNSVTSIEPYAFSDCSSLTSINLPYGITSVEDRVFAHCEKLSAISIPRGVQRIGYAAFITSTSLVGH